MPASANACRYGSQGQSNRVSEVARKMANINTNRPVASVRILRRSRSPVSGPGPTTKAAGGSLGNRSPRWL